MLQLPAQSKGHGYFYFIHNSITTYLKDSFSYVLKINSCTCTFENPFCSITFDLFLLKCFCHQNETRCGKDAASVSLLLCFTLHQLLFLKKRSLHYVPVKPIYPVTQSQELELVVSWMSQVLNGCTTRHRKWKQEELSTRWCTTKAAQRIRTSRDTHLQNALYRWQKVSGCTFIFSRQGRNHNHLYFKFTLFFQCSTHADGHFGSVMRRCH